MVYFNPSSKLWLDDKFLVITHSLIKQREKKRDRTSQERKKNKKVDKM